jgi:dethiobiotin synthetase
VPPSAGVFVTGTDTEVGKTVVACAIAAALADQGRRVSVFKPVVTGLADQSGPPDHERLRASARSSQRATDVAPYRFEPPVSPHLAADLSGMAVDPAVVRQAACAAGAAGEVLVAEGVGGLMVPLAGDYLVRDLAVDLALPVVIAARPGLGTINHTLLTVECARTAGLDVRAVVLTPWTPGTMHDSNRETIAAATGVEVWALPPLDTRLAALPAQPQLPVERLIDCAEPARAVAA